MSSCANGGNFVRMFYKKLGPRIRECKNETTKLNTKYSLSTTI